MAASPGAASVDGASSLIRHGEMPIRWHIKVKGEAHPFNGDWVYWGARLGHDLTNLVQLHAHCHDVAHSKRRQ